MNPIKQAIEYLKDDKPITAQAWALVSIAQSLEALADTFKQAAAEGAGDRSKFINTETGLEARMPKKEK
jgi:hypothetical protein